MKNLFRPLGIALGILLSVGVITWIASKLFSFPTWILLGIGVLTALITGYVDVQKNMTLKSYFRAISAWFTDAIYLYEVDIRIKSKSNIGISSLVELVNRSYMERAKLGVRGSNYLQLKLFEPARTVEIRIQPDAAQMAYVLDEDDTEVQEARIITIRLLDPIEFHYRQSDVNSVRDTLDVLRDIANDVSKMSKGQDPYFTVTVNRSKKGMPLKHPKGPGPGGVVQDNPNVRIRRDDKALQLQSTYSPSLIQYLTEKITDLEPVG